MQPSSSTAQRLRIALFLAALFAPLADVALRDTARRGPTPERRIAAPFPAFPDGLRVATKWPARFESFWNDTFGLRDHLLRLHSIIKIFGFGIAPSSRHVLGRDNWLFFAGDESMTIHRGALPMSPERVEEWCVRLRLRREWLARRGIEFAFVVAPNKESIYPEFLSRRFAAASPDVRTRFDQLLAHMQEHAPEVTVIDLRHALRVAKAHDTPDDRLYYPYGPHWTQRGAVVACREILRQLQPRYPTLPQTVFAGYDQFVNGQSGDCEADAMYVGDLFPQADLAYSTPSDWGIQVREERASRDHFVAEDPNHPERPHALILHDSFGPPTDRPLAEAFSRTHSCSGGFFDTEFIQRERPDLVIELKTERSLYFLGTVRWLPPDWVDQLQRQFMEAQQVVYALDAMHGAAEWEQVATAVTLGRDRQGSFVEITAADAVALPLLGIAPEPGAHWIAEVDAALPAGASLAFEFCDAGGRGLGATAIDVASGTGYASWALALVVPPEAASVVLRFGPGTMRLRTLEIRAAAPVRR